MAEHFIIAGAQRSGTTGVCRLLQQHPDICLAAPLRPEPKYFLRPDCVQAGYDAYLDRHFGHRGNESVLGEKSTSYIERIEAAPRIRALLPDARLIFVLRDPVIRAYSNWRFSRTHGLETLDFEQALEAEKDRMCTHDADTVSVNPFAYAARGHYVRYLDRWADHFDRDRFIILVSENIFENHDTIRGVFKQLAVRDDVDLAATGPVNVSTGAHSPLSEVCKARLREEFAESTQALHDRWGVDVSRWT